MNRAEILEAVTTIFRSELDNDAIVLHEHTTAKDIDEWDSLSHVQMIVAIEKHFKIRFSAREIQSWQAVATLIDNIEAKK